MAKHYSKSEIPVNKTTKAEHHYIVGYVTQNGKINLLPSIPLKIVSWSRINVTVEDGKLIIEPAMLV